VFALRAEYVALRGWNGRPDAVVLSGGIGENGVSMRRRILQRMDFGPC
jgi:acetate kinase